jgi:hypothetical protein
MKRKHSQDLRTAIQEIGFLENLSVTMRIAILNHLRDYCRGNPPVVARFIWGRHGGTTPTNFVNHLGLLYKQKCGFKFKQFS